jgi:hypothetical protein
VHPDKNKDAMDMERIKDLNKAKNYFDNLFSQGWDGIKASYQIKV